MKKLIVFFGLIAFSDFVAQEDTSAAGTKQKGEPFEGMDLTWLNGGDRRVVPTLAGKYFVPTVMLDGNYSYSFNDPIDNTVVGSTAMARNNEMQISAVHLGGDFNYKQARAHIVTQFGTRSTVVPRNDYSPYKGQYQLADVYRYLAEANAGYHFARIQMQRNRSDIALRSLRARQYLFPKETWIKFNRFVKRLWKVASKRG